MKHTLAVIEENELALFSKIASEVSAEETFNYSVTLRQQTIEIDLDLERVSGGGFEGDYEFTRFSALLDGSDDFYFAIHSENFVDEIFKFFGAQDLVVGFPEFDKSVVVKANDATKVRRLFSDERIRGFLQSLEDDFHFGIVNDHHRKALVLTINTALTDAPVLAAAYRQFCSVLKFLTH